MSIKLMTAVWEIDLPASDKLVLLALADCANDEGGCWPSMATLVKKCSKGERTVQASIKSLVKLGHITRDERPGKGCLYTVHPVRAQAEMPGYSPPETHYVYKITNAETGEFYIGARSCFGDPIDDSYMGSGKWAKEARASGAPLSKTVVEVVPSREALAHAELKHARASFTDELCRNAKLPSPKTLTPTGFRGHPAENAPRNNCAPQKLTKTPAKSADKPSRTITDKHTKRALPVDWKPEPFGPDSQCRAIVDNWTPKELATQIEHFGAHHRGKGNRFLDWQDVWKTWVLNSRRFAKSERRPANDGAGSFLASLGSGP